MPLATRLRQGSFVNGAAVRSLPFIDGARTFQTLSDADGIGTTGVTLGHLRYAEHANDTSYLGHVDRNTSNLNFQLFFKLDGDTTLKAPGANRTLILLAGDSGASSGFLMVNASTIRLQWNNTGLGLFGAAPTARSTGWTAVGNPAVVKTFDTATVTLQQLAQAWGTLQAELVTKGLIAV